MNGVQGNLAAQVRMFAHDAREVQLVKGSATGAAAMNSGVIVNGGSGYATGLTYGVATTGGSGSGLTVDINVVDGVVNEVFIADFGNASYVEGETLTIQPSP